MRPLRGRILAVTVAALTGVTVTGCVGYHERYDHDVVYRSAPYYYSSGPRYYYDDGPIVVYQAPRYTYQHGFAYKPGKGPPPFKRHWKNRHHYYYYDHGDDD